MQRPEDGTAIIRPVTPVSTLLAMGDLIPDDDLVDHRQPRLALEQTPVRGGLVEWVHEALVDAAATDE